MERAISLLSEFLVIFLVVLGPMNKQIRDWSIQLNKTTLSSTFQEFRISLLHLISVVLTIHCQKKFSSLIKSKLLMQTLLLLNWSIPQWVTCRVQSCLIMVEAFGEDCLIFWTKVSCCRRTAFYFQIVSCF